MTQTKTKSKKVDKEFVSPEQKLCERLIELIEKGVSPWRKEWKGANLSVHRNLITGSPYRGGNPMILEFQLAFGGHSLPLWCGAGQAKQKKWMPKKGSFGAYIIRPQLNSYDKKDENGSVVTGEDGNPLKSSWVSYKPVCVFNAEFLRGVDDAAEKELQQTIEQMLSGEGEQVNDNSLIDLPHTVLTGYSRSQEIPFNYFGDRAFYSPVKDEITVPKIESFNDSEAFYATLAHECIHSTGHDKRLKRKFGVRGAGEESLRNYAAEELVAEMGAFILCNRMQISSNCENHAAYLEGWLKVLKEGPKSLFKVIGDATKAANFIFPDSPESNDDR
jgi:antirestriction protein ArdC